MSEGVVLSRTSTELFNEVLERRLRLCKEVLAKKAQEYAADHDRFHNFNVAGRILGTTPEDALIGMFMKHLVSVLDIVDNLREEAYPPAEMVDEKIGDAINYLILLEGLLKKRIETRKSLISTYLFEGGDNGGSRNV